jgi:hypothetical protein
VLSGSVSPNGSRAALDISRCPHSWDMEPRIEMNEKRSTSGTDLIKGGTGNGA